MHCCGKVFPRVRSGQSVHILENGNRRPGVPKFFEQSHVLPESAGLLAVQARTSACKGEVRARGGSPSDGGIVGQIVAGELTLFLQRIRGLAGVLCW